METSVNEVSALELNKLVLLNYEEAQASIDARSGRSNTLGADSHACNCCC